MKNRKLRNFCIVVGGIALTIGVLNILPPKKSLNGEQNPFIIEEGSRPLIAAHRGGKNLNPENTFKAINYSYEHFGIDIIEMDLCLTLDNNLVLSHNSYINTYTEEVDNDEKVYVNDKTLEELRRYNFGYNFKDKEGNYIYRDLLNGVADEDKSQVLYDNDLRVVTIQELFDVYSKTDVKYIIEIKDGDDNGYQAADILVAAIKQYNVEDKVVIGTFNTEVEKYVEEKYPEIMRGASMGTAAKFVVTQMLGVNIFETSNITALQIPTDYDVWKITLKLDKKSYLRRAHRRNISVQFWTINEKEEMRELIELGADVIMTDNPDVLNNLLNEMGY